jgi:hypothetical protein
MGTNLHVQIPKLLCTCIYFLRNDAQQEQITSPSSILQQHVDRTVIETIARVLQDGQKIAKELERAGTGRTIEEDHVGRYTQNAKREAQGQFQKKSSANGALPCLSHFTVQSLS